MTSPGRESGKSSPGKVRRDISRTVLERDRFICQYCGTDGLMSYEAFCTLRADLVWGKDDVEQTPERAVTSCAPCATIRGKMVPRALDMSAAMREIREHVARRRAEEVEVFVLLRTRYRSR